MFLGGPEHTFWYDSGGGVWIYSYNRGITVVVTQAAKIDWTWTQKGLEISIRYVQGLQETFCKAEQDYFGGPGTGWDFSQNWEFEVQQTWKTVDIYEMIAFLVTLFLQICIFWLYVILCISYFPLSRGIFQKGMKLPITFPLPEFITFKNHGIIDWKVKCWRTDDRQKVITIAHVA
jgi:hypothetical protein